MELDESGRITWVQLMGTHNLRRCEIALHSKLEALRWAIENMLQHSTCQRFGTDCNDSRPTSLAKFFNSAGGHSNFPDVFSRLNPKAQNEIDDSLVKNIRSFHRSFYFIGCFIHV